MSKEAEDKKEQERIQAEKEALLSEIKNTYNPGDEKNGEKVDEITDDVSEKSISDADSESEVSTTSESESDEASSEFGDLEDNVVISNAEPLPKYGKSFVFIPIVAVLTILGVVFGHIGPLTSGVPQAAWMRYTYIGLGVVILYFGISMISNSVVEESLFTRLQMGKLITTGIYSKSRNPMYGGILLICTAILFISGNVYMYILPVVYLIILYLIVGSTEEIMLKERFGDEYVKYRNSTHFFLPTKKKG